MKKFISCCFIFLFILSTNYAGKASEFALDYYRLKNFYKWLNPEVYYNINKEVKKYNNPYLSTDLVCSVIKHESGNYCKNRLKKMQKVVSCAGAIGIMQVMPCNYKGPKKNLKKLSVNINRGVSVLNFCLKKAKGNKKEALRFYNAGPYSKKHKYKNWKYVHNILKDYKKSFLACN
jgi:soluble lytic murein transglycosylase-like protein